MTHEHGTWRGYVRDGCRCRPCTVAWGVYRHKLDLRHGRGQVWADPDRYQRLLKPFVDADVSPYAIKRLFGMKTETVTSLMFGTGRVRADAASRLDGICWDSLDDRTQVSADLLRDVVGQLRDVGVAPVDMARALGWSGWPGPDYPKGRRVALGSVRTLRRLLVEVTTPSCEDCGAEPLAGGRWCLQCFNLRSLPQSRRDVEVAARRERDRLAKRQSRSAA